MLSEIFARYSCFGFGGSRRPAGRVPVAALSAAAAAVPASASVVVGCARGIDAYFRQVFPSARVFHASDFGQGRWAFARRSVACVEAVAAAGGLWVSFPASACPPGVVPSRSWSGHGSGSWGSAALAIGRGVPCLVFSVCGVPVGWGFEPLPGCPGWEGVALSVPTPTQLSLF